MNVSVRTSTAWRRGLLTALVASPALFSLASAAEKHAAHEAHAVPSISTLFLPVVNFAIFAVVFFRYAWPAIRAALLERRSLVERELSDADRVHAESKAGLAAIEALRSELAAEGNRLVAEMRADGERDRQAMLDAAKVSAERIRNDARLLALQESSRAAQSIRAEVAEQVVRRVVAELQERLTSADDERFVARFVEALDSEAGR
jgi:F-type H+-transporting ATPase subunit b